MARNRAKIALVCFIVFSSFMLTAPEVYAGHWIQTVVDGGNIIILEDGSVWEVSPIDRIHSMLWLPVSNVVIVNHSGIYPYLIVNLSDKRAVEAKYLGQLK